MISAREVIAIIDATPKKAAFSEYPFLQHAEQDGWIEKIEDGVTKSFVITDYKIYASPISSLTLKKRAVWEQMFPANKRKKSRK
jgi:extracellular matrix regulatory protein B